MAKVVVPDAPPAPHVDQWVDWRDVLASAHDTTSVIGRTADDPEQVSTFGLEPVSIGCASVCFVAEDPTALTPTPTAAPTTATLARATPMRRIRRRRSRRRASLKSASLAGSHGSTGESDFWGISSKLSMKLL